MPNDHRALTDLSINELPREPAFLDGTEDVAVYDTNEDKFYRASTGLFALNSALLNFNVQGDMVIRTDRNTRIFAFQLDVPATLTLPLYSAVPIERKYAASNQSYTETDLTILPSGSDTINGGASLVMSPNDSLVFTPNPDLADDWVAYAFQTARRHF